MPKNPGCREIFTAACGQPPIPDEGPTVDIKQPAPHKPSDVHKPSGPKR